MKSEIILAWIEYTRIKAIEFQATCFLSTNQFIIFQSLYFTEFSDSKDNIYVFPSMIVKKKEFTFLRINYTLQLSPNTQHNCHCIIQLQIYKYPSIFYWVFFSETPGKPVNVSFHSVKATSASITWQPPNVTDSILKTSYEIGELTNCQIIAGTQKCTLSIWNDNEPIAITSYSKIDLIPFTRYNVMVCSFNDATKSRKPPVRSCSNHVSFTTAKQGKKLTTIENNVIHTLGLRIHA